ncbi:MAG TPA: T9SS type A sorting domain-containing protein, partial [Flavobacteriales bacterium]
QPSFLYDWNNTAAGMENTDACNAAAAQPGQPNGSGVPPVTGLTFKWTPPTCAPPAWPVTLSGIGFQGAMVSWPNNGSSGYDYFVSTENDINGPEVTSGSVTDPEAYLEGLDAATTYYVFVRSQCDGTPGTWGQGTEFVTHGGGVLACPDTPEEVTYCTRQYSTVYWHYMSEDGFSPVKIEFLGGFVGNLTGESLQIWNGGAPTGPPDWTAPSGDLAGQVFTASSGQLFIQAMNDIGSCESQPWYLPFQWRVGCKNCSEPLVQLAMGEVDCEAQEYFLTANVFSLGTAAEVVLQNDLGVGSTTATATGELVLGPFQTGDAVTITAVHPDNMLCNVVYAPLENEPCAITDCGPTWYEECTTEDEVETWLFEGEGQPVSVRFLPATLGWDADVLVHPSGEEAANPITLAGATNNEVVTSETGANRLLVQLVASIYPEYDCSEGLSQPLEFVVACASECEQPAATFAYAECTQPSTYNVLVNVTDLGSTGSVVITNDAGAPSLTVTAIGTYEVGPFTSNTPVRVHVEGADAICSWSSSVLNYSCLQMGLAEVGALPLRVFPNPSDGRLRLVLPAEMTSGAQLQVLDLAGRNVAQRFVNGTGEMALDLGELPNGLYTLLLRDGQHSATGKISIQH